MTKTTAEFIHLTADARMIVKQIVARIFAECTKTFLKRTNRQYWEMTLIATHSNGCPLDFRKLLELDKVDFGHDITGIDCFLDKETGELTGHFLPKCHA